MQKIKPLISENQIQKSVSELGKKITIFYKNKVSEQKPLVVIIIQKGAVIFAADLVRKINLPVDLRFIRVSSYQGKTVPQGDPEIFDKIKSGIKGDHVLVVEDILDTGKTLAFINNYLIKLQPKSLNFTILLIKKMQRKIGLPLIKFKAFDVEDKFVVGYGLDYNEIYRNLPYIGTIEV